MAQTHSGHKRIRKFYGKIREVAQMPNLIEVQRELRRIGVNVNQIARALNTAVMEGAVLALEVAQLAAFSEEIRAHLVGVRDAFQGNLAYWSVDA